MRRTLTTLNCFSTVRGIWATAQPHRPEYGKYHNVTLIPGIGIGPEITSTNYIIFS